MLHIGQSTYDLKSSRWSLGQLLSVLKWWRRAILMAILACLGGALVYLAVTPNKYIATAVLLTETRQMPGDDDASSREATVDSSVVESQVEAVRSASLALHVIDKLGLADDPEFGNPKPGLLSRLLSIVPGLGSGSREVDRREIALDNFLTKVKIERIGRSYVAQIDVTSVDSEKAAKIANAIAEGYIDEQLSSRQDTQERANKWMEDRLTELRAQAERADKEAREAASEPNPAPAASADGGPTDFKVRDLNDKARSARANYEAYQNRYTQALQLQKIAIPTTGARVLTRAIPPTRPGSPRKILVLALSLIAGCTIGVLGAFGAEFLQPAVRTRAQLSGALGIRAFGPLPSIKVRTSLFGRDKELPVALVKDAGNGAALAENELRKIKLAFGQRGAEDSARIIGVTSPRPQDGKTTISYSLALLAAQAGSRTLLIDANTHNPTLARAFCEPSAALLSDFMASTDGNFTVVRLSDHLSFLGQHKLGTDGHPADVLSCEGMRNALRRAQSHFDYIIIDLPAGLDHMEPRAIASLLDGVLIVTRWGSPIVDIEHCLENADGLASRVMGIVINKSPEVQSKGSIRPMKAATRMMAKAERAEV